MGGGGCGFGFYNCVGGVSVGVEEERVVDV